jgi:PAS domain S-box-containing protein
MDLKFPSHGYKDVFYNSIAPMLIVGTDAPHYTMLDVNNAYLFATHTRREDIIGQPVFGVFPANPGDSMSKNVERTIFSFEQAIKTKVTHTMYNYRYDIPIPGSNEFEEHYWTTSNTPVLNESNEVLYLIHSPSNVTDLYKAQEREGAAIALTKKQQLQLQSVFMQAPVGIGIFKGPDYIADLINPPLCRLYGKTEAELLGKKIFDVLPDAKGRGFEALLDNVRLTGIPYRGEELGIPMLRNDKLETVYVNFVYEPFREPDETITGVIVVATEVTELVNAKNKIEEVELRNRIAVDAVGLGTFDLDLLTNEAFTSTQFARIFGFEEALPRNNYLELFHPDDQPIRRQALKDALVTGRLFYECRIIHKDSSMHWVRAEGKVIYDDNGKPLSISGIALDITKEKKSADEQRKLISLVENSVDLMSILKMDGYNSYINEAGRKLLGFKDETEVLHRPVSELHSPEHLLQVQQEVIPSVMKTGRWSGVMIVRHLQTGENFPVYNNCFRIDDLVTGAPISIGAVMRDMRPELAAKAALADSEQMLRNITTASPAALWMSDENGHITYVNQTWVNWTGTSYEANLGSGWLQKIVEEDRIRVADKFVSDVLEKRNYEVEFRINHADGKIHWCLANGQAHYNNEGKFAGYIGSCMDITEQKMLQQQKDDFIGIASHELKTPVTTIKGYAQILEKMLQHHGLAREASMVSRMDTQLKSLTSLIADLLDVTKINSGRLQFNDREFEFNPMVNDLVEDLQRITDKHTFILHLNKTGIVFGDRERIGQVITNLITNAVKYSPGAEHIVITTAIENNEVTLCVEDYGIGIPRDKLDKVFEQFYRVSGDLQYTFPGLGLGLYISSEIIKREGGRIWVNSVEGKGSTFCFALPLVKEETDI